MFQYFSQLLLLTLLLPLTEGVCKTTPLTPLEQLLLHEHNTLRALHRDTPPLCYAETTGDDINFAAQTWADSVADTGVFKHMPNPKKFGENMAWSSYMGEGPDVESFMVSSVKRWYSEIERWDFDLGQKIHGVTTHFTQIVWKSSKQLNCGFGVSEELRRAYLVCQYWPKGNWIKRSEYYTEVIPPIGFVAKEGAKKPDEDEEKAEEKALEQKTDKSGEGETSDNEHDNTVDRTSGRENTSENTVNNILDNTAEGKTGDANQSGKQSYSLVRQETAANQENLFGGALENLVSEDSLLGNDIFGDPENLPAGCRTTPLNAVERLILDRHNEYRSRHEDTPPLCYAETGNDQFTFTAQQWAGHIGETGEYRLSPSPKDYGENMYWSSIGGSDEDPDPAPFFLSATDRWYRGIENWDFELGAGKGLTTPFTQLVWKSSTHLNCGFGVSEALRRAYVVCQYWPRGNYIKRSEYYTMVRPLKGTTTEGEDEAEPEVEEEPEEDEEEEEEEEEEEVEDEEEPISVQCPAGEYLTEDSCQQCGENTYSGAGATSCTGCPEGYVSAAGSTSAQDCNLVPQRPDKEYHNYTICDCWNPNCNYCSNPACTVQHDFENSPRGVTVNSLVTWGEYTSLVLYTEEGEQVGMFQWNKRGIHLTGCISCVSPPSLRGKCIKDVPTLWEISITNGVLQIRIHGEVVYENVLRGKCKEAYSKAKRFAFLEAPEGSYFVFDTEEMQAGENVAREGCV